MIESINHLHSDTLYECKNLLDSSDAHILAKGVREGCPSSCVLFLVFHNAVLKDFGRTKAEDRRGWTQHVSLRWKEEAKLAGRLATKFSEEEKRWSKVGVSLMCLADDKILVERSRTFGRSKARITEAHVRMARKSPPRKMAVHEIGEKIC